eukprot:501610-Rhodomonas_salina.1
MSAIDNKLQGLAEKLIDKGADVQVKDRNVSSPLRLSSPLCGEGCSRFRKRQELHAPRSEDREKDRKRERLIARAWRADGGWPTGGGRFVPHGSCDALRNQACDIIPDHSFLAWRVIEKGRQRVVTRTGEETI